MFFEFNTKRCHSNCTKVSEIIIRNIKLILLKFKVKKLIAPGNIYIRIKNFIIVFMQTTGLFSFTESILGARDNRKITNVWSTNKIQMNCILQFQ